MTEAQMPASPECGEFVFWYDGEYEGQCELPDGHSGHHFDGVSCFTGEWAGDRENVYPCELAHVDVYGM